MKRYLMGAALCCAMLFCGCNNDDEDEGQGGEGSLLGTWKSVECYEYVNGSWVKDESYSEPICAAGEYYTLTFTDDTHVRVIEEGDDYGTTSYTFENNILRIGVFSMDWEVEELTDDRMVVLKKTFSVDYDLLDERVVFRKE